MVVFLLSEVAFFGTLIMTYVFFLNQTTQGSRIRGRFSVADGPGGLGLPVVQQRDDSPGRDERCAAVPIACSCVGGV